MSVHFGRKFLTSGFLQKSFLPSVVKCSTTAAATSGSGGSYSNEKTTHFGFKTVTEEEKKNKGFNDGFYIKGSLIRRRREYLGRLKKIPREKLLKRNVLLLEDPKFLDTLDLTQPNPTTLSIAMFSIP